MGKIRILHLADTHLGVETYGRIDPATGLNSRLLDFAVALDQAVDYALNGDVHLVVFAGDAYRSRDPNSTCQREFARRIWKLASQGIQVFLLVGNHDLPAAAGRANSVDIFETLEVQNVHVGRKPGLYRIHTRAGPVQIVALPWLSRSQVFTKEDQKNRTPDEINELVGAYVSSFVSRAAAELDQIIPAVLVAHLSVMGAVWGSEKSVMLGQDFVVPRSLVALPAFDYVALGHVHRHQVLGNIPLTVYPGSLERIDFGEEKEDKGFVVVELEKGSAEYDFHKVDARRFLTVEIAIRTDDPMPEILSCLEKQDLAGAIVRVLIRTTEEREGSIQYNEIRRYLVSREVAHVAAITKHVERKHRTVFSGKLAEEMTPLQALDLYLKNKQVSPDRAGVLMRYAGMMVQDVVQKGEP